MEKKNVLIAVIIGLIIAGGAFYGGMKYSANKAVSQISQNRCGGNFGGQRQGGGQGQGMQNGGGRQGGMQNGGAGDFVGGEIISKDDSSVTIKTRDGGSKIVFFSDKTLIDKSVSGATSDLSVGLQVTANGKANSDGSLTAQNIQIRPIK